MHNPTKNIQILGFEYKFKLQNTTKIINSKLFLKANLTVQRDPQSTFTVT